MLAWGQVMPGSDTCTIRPGGTSANWAVPIRFHMLGATSVAGGDQ